jgi:hypothetical protein
MKTVNIRITVCILALLLQGSMLVSQNNYSGLFSSTSEISRLKFDETPLNYKANYRNAIGIRAGGTSGLTFKHFINSSDAIEGILGLWPNALGITGLYERHVSTKVDGLKFYYGGGAHFTAETDHYYYRRNDDGYVYRYGHDGIGIGIDGILGIEYKIPVIPFAISLDLKPFLEVSNYGHVYSGIDPSLGIKVAF